MICCWYCPSWKISKGISMFQNVDDLEICQIFSKLSNYFCHTNISNYLPNISDLYTSSRVCCDRDRTSPSCAQSRKPHRSPLAPLQCVYYSMYIGIFAPACDSIDIHTDWGTEMSQTSVVVTYLCSGHPHLIPLFYVKCLLTFNVQVYVKESKEVPETFI